MLGCEPGEVLAERRYGVKLSPRAFDKSTVAPLRRLVLELAKLLGSGDHSGWCRAKIPGRLLLPLDSQRRMRDLEEQLRFGGRVVWKHLLEAGAFPEPPSKKIVEIHDPSVRGLLHLYATLLPRLHDEYWTLCVRAAALCIQRKRRLKANWAAVQHLRDLHKNNPLLARGELLTLASQGKSSRLTRRRGSCIW